MKQENIIALIKELLEIDTLHQQYQDEDINCVIDAKREGNNISINVTLQNDKDKKDFEKWVDQLDDDLFNETWETLSKEFDLHKLHEIYNSSEYKKVIKQFKDTARKIASNKVNNLIKLFNL